MILLWVDTPQNVIPYNIIEWTVEKWTIFNASKRQQCFQGSDYIKCFV